MGRLKVLTIALLILILVTPAYGKNFSVRRTVEGYTLDASINRNPPVLGKNDLWVEIKDSAGRYVVGALVTVNYFMPPMPGMPPMNFTVKASPRSSGYEATMNFIMKGPWNIIIREGVGTKQLRMTVLIDVR